MRDARARRDWSGARLVRASLVLGAVGVAPLALYLLLGPADGNPIGLGLLAVVTVPLAALGVGVGLLAWLFQRLTRRER